MIMFKSAKLIILYILFISISKFTLSDYIDNNNDFPLPAFTMNLKQSEGIAIDNRRTHRRLQEINKNSEQTPLFQGMGTHYSFLWVGTPPQRASVIVDTGSHHTAFPCVGCKCGKHMDPHFDPNKSNTSVISNCASSNIKNSGESSKCFFRQSYSEGSSWQAYKVSDNVWIGGKDISSINNADTWSTKFDFGCLSSETGLFRTQNVDGIMGMSAAENTLPWLLVKNKITKSKVFAMCFKIGGGILTIGGVDPSIHNMNNKPSTVLYAKSYKPMGWFTVKLLDILFKNPITGELKSIGVPSTTYNTGKGVIVDSGTTDTYLPSQVRSNFEKSFKEFSNGIKYSTNYMQLSTKQRTELPSIIYRIQGLEEGLFIDIESLPSSYSEQDITGKNTIFRIYLTERSGSVLGANFMNGHNVIFDAEGLRVGFAKSDCEYKPKHHSHQHNKDVNDSNNLEITNSNTFKSRTTTNKTDEAYKEVINNLLSHISVDTTNFNDTNLTLFISNNKFQISVLILSIIFLVIFIYRWCCKKSRVDLYVKNKTTIFNKRHLSV